MPYQRTIVYEIMKRINEPKQFIQVVIGPRQTGKTTAVTQALSKFSLPYKYTEATFKESGSDWLKAQWQLGRNLVSTQSPSALLVIDEVQYIPNWSAVVKTLWDEDKRNNVDLRVLLTGSSAALLQSGMAESLMGRYELIESPHWTYSECKDAFGMSLEEFLYFGSYPGAASLISNKTRWLNYVKSSIIEPSIAIDVPLLGDVRKPELMRRLFDVGAPYSGEEISYRKLLGQLDDKGNTSTIANYLTLLSRAGLISGIQKFDPKLLREKASSPRLCVHNTALMTASFGRNRRNLMSDSALHGRLVESAVGAYLINRSISDGFDVYWWRDGNDEVDFVIADGPDITAIEVKSGRVKSTSGMQRFILENPTAKELVVGSYECPLESFLLGDIDLFL